jgi:hypothetical protein
MATDKWGIQPMQNNQQTMTVCVRRCQKQGLRLKEELIGKPSWRKGDFCGL